MSKKKELEVKHVDERVHTSTESPEAGEDFLVLTVRIRFENKDLIIKMRDDQVFHSLRKPLLRQLIPLGFCRGEGKMAFSYDGHHIVSSASIIYFMIFDSVLFFSANYVTANAKPQR